MAVDSTGESLGGGVDLDKVEEDSEFRSLASMSVEDIENLIMNPSASGEKQAELQTPDSQQAQSGNEQADNDLPETDDELAAAVNKLLNRGSGKSEDKAEKEDSGEAPQKQQTVPHQALHAARKDGQAAKEEVKTMAEQLEELRLQNAYLMGLQQARQAEQQQGQRQSAPAPDPMQEINSAIKKAYDEKEAALDALAEQYDNAEIDRKTERQRQREIERQYNESVVPLVQKREQLSSKNQVDPTYLESQINNDPWLQQNTERLRQENPWIDDIPDRMFQAIQAEALQLMEQRGFKPEPTAQSAWMLRQTIAEVGKNSWQLDKFISGATAPSSGNKSQPQASASAQDRLSKLELAKKHPPNMGMAGKPSSASEGSLDGRLQGVTSQELAGLGTAELERLLGVS